MKDEAFPEPSGGFRAFLRYRLGAIVWSALLLLLSTAMMSAHNTGRGLEDLLLRLLGHEPSIMTVAVANTIVRKFSHVVAYGIEGALMLRAARSGRRGHEMRWIVAALLWTLLIASLDEFNQSFSIWRSGSPEDVVLDMTGAGLAVIYFRRRDSA